MIPRPPPREIGLEFVRAEVPGQVSPGPDEPKHDALPVIFQVCPREAVERRLEVLREDMRDSELGPADLDPIGNWSRRSCRRLGPGRCGVPVRGQGKACKDRCRGAQ